jgi:hypothetical protein
MKAGSQWNKWNFHVHTKGTNKNDLFTSPTMDDFFCVFYKQVFVNKVSAIGITDYFSIDKYLEAVEYRKDIASKVSPDGSVLFSGDEIKWIEDVFLFPNVE